MREGKNAARRVDLAAGRAQAYHEPGGSRRVPSIDSGVFTIGKSRASAYAVSRSSSDKKNIACEREAPHMSAAGCRLLHTAGRSGRPKILQPSRSSSWMQRTPAGLPLGMPGIGELIDGAMQQAPQPGRQEMGG